MVSYIERAVAYIFVVEKQKSLHQKKVRFENERALMSNRGE